MIKLKKFICIFLILLISISVPLNGANKNNLSFYEKGSNLYYRKNQFDSNLFLHRENMRPGNSVLETLNIHNETSREYGVYLQSVPAQRSENVEEFLKNISIIVKNNGKVITEGNMLGESTSASRESLLDKIYLGEYAIGETGVLEVTVRLNPDYVPPEEEIDTYVDWKFYAEADGELVEIMQDTGGEDFGCDKLYWVENLLFFTLVIMMSLTAVVVEVKKRKNKKSETDEAESYDEGNNYLNPKNEQ